MSYFRIIPSWDKEVLNGRTFDDEQERESTPGCDGEGHEVRDEDQRGVGAAGFELSADVSDCEAVWGRRCGGAGASRVAVGHRIGRGTMGKSGRFWNAVRKGMRVTARHLLWKNWRGTATVWITRRSTVADPGGIMAEAATAQGAPEVAGTEGALWGVGPNGWQSTSLAGVVPLVWTRWTDRVPAEHGR